MGLLKLAAISVAMFAASPAWCITKCTGADGKVVFQDVPCAGKSEQLIVRPASGNAPAPKVSSDTATRPSAPPVANAPKASAEGAFGESWQRRTYLENRGLADARSALAAHQNRCDAQQRDLSAKKGRAANNLAGATWEQSISAEMQAAATLCDSRARELRSNLDSVERELRDLQSK